MKIIQLVPILTVLAAVSCRTQSVDEPNAGTHQTAGWAQVSEILARIKEPNIPSREFSILDFGAKPDGQTDCSAAIAQAIETATKAGGGRVIVPAGEYLTGPIHLRSRIELHLEKGATLKFSTDSRAYLPAVRTRYEGMDLWNYSPLIYACEQEDIAITGEGTLDGQASLENWWGWHEPRKTDGFRHSTAGVKRLAEMVAAGTPVDERRFGEGNYLRPSFIEPYRCRNVLIEGVRIRRSPMWIIHPLFSTNVIVRGVDISSHGRNNDGCDPESCRDVLIEDVTFDTGDDCIAIKSGRNDDGRRAATPSENLVIRGCRMQAGHGGVVIGSEISGGCRNVFVEDCDMDSPRLDRMLRFKSNALRGGVVENIFMRDIRVGTVRGEVLQIDHRYGGETTGDGHPVVRNVLIERVTVRDAPRVLDVRGIEEGEIRHVRLIDCTIGGLRQPDVVDQADVELVDCRLEPQTPRDE